MIPARRISLYAKTGERLRGIRKAHGLSRAELAAKLRTSTSTLDKWEEGITPPSLERLVDLAEVYDLGLDDLVAGP